MLRFRVAEVEIELQAGDVEFFAKRTAPYASDATAPIQLQMKSHVVDEIVPPEGEPLFSVHQRLGLRLPDGDLVHYRLSSDEKRVIQLTRHSPDASQAEMWCAFGREDQAYATEYEYAYTGFHFAHRLSALGGAVLHGSAIAYRGEGIVFSAPSGTGKSTHTSFWKERFGEDVIFVNDDKPALRFPAGERPMMYGTPWSGKTDLNTNLAVPLKAIVFLQRGAENSIRRLSFPESMFHLSEELVRPYTDEQVGARLVDRMIELAQGTPIYLLTCTKDPAAADYCRDALFH